MKGDFTRRTFDSRRGYSRVLMQQRRVTLDADHMKVEIVLHYVRVLAADWIARHVQQRVRSELPEHYGRCVDLVAQSNRGRWAERQTKNGNHLPMIPV